jgi:hypothetical protein
MLGNSPELTEPTPKNGRLSGTNILPRRLSLPPSAFGQYLITRVSASMSYSIIDCTRLGNLSPTWAGKRIASYVYQYRAVGNWVADTIAGSNRRRLESMLVTEIWERSILNYTTTLDKRT